MLLAAAQETGLLTALEKALPTGAAVPPRLAQARRKTRRQSLLTLLFLPVVGLRRTGDLRHYTGDALASLSGRRRAYGFWWVERFLSEVARAGGAETLTDALAGWTAKLWLADKADPDHPVPAFYVDGHKKPVYSDHLIPRGLVGRTGKVLGCRTLVLLHDAAGHPLLATTHRGDLSLKEGLPLLVTHYEQAEEGARLGRLVVDREGMAAEWLAGLAAQGRTVVTVLRADQYQGLASFSEIGPFVPWRHNRQGQMTREVASARFALPLPDHPGQQLPLWVALVRDWTRQVPVPASRADQASPSRWDADLEWKAGWWWDADWVATPSRAPLTEPKLIPIVTTAPIQDAVALAETYTHRWPAQENSFRDWLLAVGLDINHGYHSVPVENSEVSKRRVYTPLQRSMREIVVIVAPPPSVEALRWMPWPLQPHTWASPPSMPGLGHSALASTVQIPGERKSTAYNHHEDAVPTRIGKIQGKDDPQQIQTCEPKPRHCSGQRIGGPHRCRGPSAGRHERWKLHEQPLPPP